MENRPEVCAVVVTYNRKGILKKCIDSILGQKNAECDLIIIDSASSDGTEEMIKSKYNLKRIRYYKTDENYGCAGGFNIGIRLAVELEYKYIWLMDDDVLPCNDALCELLDADNKLQGMWGGLSSVAYWKDGKLCKANIQKKGVFTFLKHTDYKNSLVRVKMISWASMLIKADTVKKVGLPIKDYFIYGDDYEFSLRTGKDNPLYVVTNSKVLHEMEDNRKANFVKATDDRADRFKYLYRNDIHLYRQLGAKGLVYLFLKDVLTVCYILVAEKKRKREKIGVVIRGVHEGVAFQPQVEMIEM